MTKPLTSKHQRLLAIERRLAKLQGELPDAIKLRVDNALLVATVGRLIGENEALRRNVRELQVYAETLKGRRAAA